MNAPLSITSETLHATTVARGGRAVVITGPSGAGKSDLALRLFDRGFTLVSDDRTVIRRDGDRLIASAPERIAGKLEVRGLGILDVETSGDVPVALLVELARQIERMPADNRDKPILGVSIPLVRIDAMTASASSKVALALDRLGLRP